MACLQDKVAMPETALDLRTQVKVDERFGDMGISLSLCQRGQYQPLIMLYVYF